MVSTVSNVKVQHGLLSSRALPGRKRGLIYWTPLRDLSSFCISTLSPAACWTWRPRAWRGPEVRSSDLDITPSLITQGRHMLVSNHGQEDNSERGKVTPSIYTAIVPPFACSFLSFIIPHWLLHFSFLVDFSFSIFALLNVFFTTMVSPSLFLHSFPIISFQSPFWWNPKNQKISPSSGLYNTGHSLFKKTAALWMTLNPFCLAVVGKAYPLTAHP